MEVGIKIILSILFILCLFPMPYGFYQLVRFLALIGFVILAFFSYQKNENLAVIFYIGLALLFQPILKIALGRTIWNIIDVIVAVVLIISILIAKSKVSNA
ncbi:MAG: hypothetical protein H0U27_02830 [Nitrosopumilus sp.]|nr:hypothetical protein [Nitrosopumilus sp.]